MKSAKTAHKTCFTLIKQGHIKYFKLKRRSNKHYTQSASCQGNMITFNYNKNEKQFENTHFKMFQKSIIGVSKLNKIKKLNKVIPTLFKVDQKKDLIWMKQIIETSGKDLPYFNIVKQYNKYYICIPYERKVIKKEPKFNSIALDPGIRTFQRGFSPNGRITFFGKNNMHVQQKIAKLYKKIDNISTKIDDKKKLKDPKAYNAKLGFKYVIKLITKLIRKEIKNSNNDYIIKMYTNLRKLYIKKIDDLNTEKCKLFSKINKLNIKRRKYYRRITSVVNNMHKQIAKYLFKNNKVVILPKFDTSEIVKKSDRRDIADSTARMCNSLAHYKFKMYMVHKARCYKNRALVICNEYNTTKRCSSCGKLNNNVGGDKTYNCINVECELIAGRDVNSGKNIYMDAVLDLVNKVKK